MGVLPMAFMGLMTSVVAPLLVLALRDRVGLGPLDHRAAVALPGFVLLHAAIVLGVEAAGMWPMSVHVWAAAIVFVGAMVFWSPVLGRAHRLADDLGAVYLYLAAPTLDIPAVILIARGDSAGGLAMIVGMLPIGLIAVARTWRWLTAEEAAACRDPGTPGVTSAL